MRAALRANASANLSPNHGSNHGPNATKANNSKSIIEPLHLGLELTRSKQSDDSLLPITTDNKPFNDVVADFQRQLIVKALANNGNVWAKAARELQLDRANLHRLAKRLGVVRDE